MAQVVLQLMLELTLAMAPPLALAPHLQPKVPLEPTLQPAPAPQLAKGLTEPEPARRRLSQRLQRTRLRTGCQLSAVTTGLQLQDHRRPSSSLVPQQIPMKRAQQPAGSQPVPVETATTPGLAPWHHS